MPKINRKLFREANDYLVGGVDSPVRSFRYAGAEPLLIKKGKGSKVYDYDGKRYIDYVLSWGSLILGHSFPAAVRAVKKAVNSGFSFGTTHHSEIDLARLITEAVPSIERIRFVNSGTEAVMGAVRLSRAYTGRDKIVKFQHSYHGHADYLLVKAGSGLATLGIPLSPGVPQDFIRHTLLAPLGDIKVLEALFKKYGNKIAAVLIEPVGGNYGVVPADRLFLRRVRSLTRKYKSLLVFDEIITGFRFRFGTASQELGITPDLICLGKIIGGGLPIGAYGGSSEIMDNLAPLGKVYQASTFSGNPVVMQAGLAVLKALRGSQGGYARSRELNEYLVFGIKQAASVYGIDLQVNYYANIFSLRFNHKGDFQRFYQQMLKQGVFLAPSEFEANFLSFAHTREDIKKTLAAVTKALKNLRSQNDARD